jgi:Contractile injection system tube protein
MPVAMNGPRLQKGMLVGIDLTGARVGAVSFQYNPQTLTRSITPAAPSENGDTKEALRLKAPPSESISLEAALDATDQLEAGHTPANAGLHSDLAALELLLYPSSASVLANEVLSRLGLIEIVPAMQPLTLFVWGGIRRVLPVRLTSLNITEEAFDTNLNPIRATAKISMQVLTYHDLGLLTPGGALFFVHQVMKEVMAGMGGHASDPVSATVSLSVGVG